MSTLGQLQIPDLQWSRHTSPHEQKVPARPTVIGNVFLNDQYLAGWVRNRPDMPPGIPIHHTRETLRTLGTDRFHRILPPTQPTTADPVD